MTGTEISGCTDDRAERQVGDRIVETGSQRYLIADGHIGYSRLIAAPAGMPSRDRWAANPARPHPRLPDRSAIFGALR